MRRTRIQFSSDPLAPIETAVSAILFLVVALTGVFALIAGVQYVASGSTSVSVAGLGDAPCVDVGQQGIGGYGASGSYTRSDGTEVETDGSGLTDLRGDKASAVQQRWTLCLNDATAVQHVAATATTFCPFLFGVVALLMVLRAVRTARRSGLFTEPTARVVRQLGLYLVVGAGLGPIALAACRGIVVEAAIDDVGWAEQLIAPDLGWTLIMVGVGVVTFARILRTAVPLQAEVDATV